MAFRWKKALIISILFILFIFFVTKNEFQVLHVSAKGKRGPTSSDFEFSKKDLEFILKDWKLQKEKYFPQTLNEERPTERQRGQKTIPKIIHQIWNDEIVPAEFVDSVTSLVRDNPHPEWKYVWWTKESGMKFVRDKFPNLVGIMERSSNVMRADFLRYLIMYEYGGVYFDLDTVSVKSLDDFVTSHQCSLAREPSEHAFDGGREFLLTNSALFCIRRHSFFAHLIVHLNKIGYNCRVPFQCTGPQMLTKFWREFNKSDVFAGVIPAVQKSELFQDVYDDRRQRRRLESNCKNETLPPFQKELCSNWIARGKEKRNLSELAITYHTWFHVQSGRKLTILDKNHIKQVVSHARIYGKPSEGYDTIT